MLTFGYINKLAKLAGACIRFANDLDLEQLKNLYSFKDEMETNDTLGLRDRFEQAALNNGMIDSVTHCDSMFVITNKANNVLGYIHLEFDKQTREAGILSFAVAPDYKTSEANQLFCVFSNSEYDQLLMMYTILYCKERACQSINVIATKEFLKLYSGYGFNHFRMQDHHEWWCVVLQKEKLNSFCEQHGGHLVHAFSAANHVLMTTRVSDAFSNVMPYRFHPIATKDHTYKTREELDATLNFLIGSMNVRVEFLVALSKLGAALSEKQPAINALSQELSIFSGIIYEFEQRLSRVGRFVVDDEGKLECEKIKAKVVHDYYMNLAQIAMDEPHRIFSYNNEPSTASAPMMLEEEDKMMLEEEDKSFRIR